MAKKKTVKVPNNLKPLKDLALHSPYTMGYLSLMARRKQLKVKKIGRVWYSSTADIKEFEEKMKKQKEERNEQLRKSYVEKAEKVQISVMDNRKALTNDTIFDEVQRELGDILQEIRAREKKLRHNYMVHRGDILGNGREKNLEKEKQITQDLSGQLIDDMGRLLRTASEIHNHPAAREIANEQRVFDPHKLPEDKEHLLGNYHKDNFLSVPYSYFPFEDTKRLAQQNSISLQNKILLFVSGILVFVAALLTVLVLFK